MSTLKYTSSHEWVALENNTATVGITDHAQSLLGDLVYVELPEVGARFSAGQECAVVESVKAASDVYAPLSGEVIAVNEALVNAPELVNSSPVKEGWLFKLNISDANEYQQLLDLAAYEKQIQDEDA